MQQMEYVLDVLPEIVRRIRGLSTTAAERRG
jgi:hypothetical protein